MIEIVEQQIEYRERVRMPRKDFIQSLIQLRNTGAIHEVDRDDWDLKASDERTLKKMSIKECAAQVFIFYMAGFDTSASTTAFSLFELARHPEIRRKLQAEIDETVARFDGVVSYECIQEMQYLEACIMGVMFMRLGCNEIICSNAISTDTSPHRNHANVSDAAAAQS